jgi:DNA sulfur modification protein DndB
MMHGAQWNTTFHKRYTIKGQESAKKDDKTNWLVKLNTIRNNADHEYSVSMADADYVAALHDWLILDDSDAICRLTATTKSVAAVDPADDQSDTA